MSAQLVSDPVKPLSNEVRDVANRLLAYREERSGKFLVFAQQGGKYAAIVLVLSLIRLLHNTFLSSWAIQLLEQFVIWIEKPFTAIFSFVVLSISFISVVNFERRVQPYQDKLNQEGYLLLQQGKSENWLVKVSSGEAERLAYIPPCSVKQFMGSGEQANGKPMQARPDQ